MLHKNCLKDNGFRNMIFVYKIIFCHTDIMASIPHKTRGIKPLDMLKLKNLLRINKLILKYAPYDKIYHLRWLLFQDEFPPFPGAASHPRKRACFTGLLQAGETGAFARMGGGARDWRKFVLKK